MRVSTFLILAAAVLATPVYAKGNSGFAGSKGVSSGPAPTPPRTTAKPPVIDASKLKLRCYHTRERNEMGIYVHRSHCG